MGARSKYAAVAMARRAPTASGAVTADIRIGVSACILGEEVRFDGGHKLDTFVRDTLGALLRFVPVCPEVEVGMGVPRPTVRLVRIGKAVRMIEPKTGTDHTAAMNAWSTRRVEKLAREGLCGFVVQTGSPSCGMERVKIHRGQGTGAVKNGRGLFTAALMARLPHLPVEEGGRLHDPRLRESFIERVFAYRRLRSLFGRPWSIGELVAFHASEKLLIMAHDRTTCDKLDRLVVAAQRRSRGEVADEYQALMMAALKRVADPRQARRRPTLARQV